MGRYEVVRHGPFRGLNLDENPLAIGDDELTRADNIWHLGGTVGTRPGTELDGDVYTSAIAGNPVIQGIFDYRRAVDTARDLVVIADEIGAGVAGRVYSGPATMITNGAGVVMTTGADNQWTFCEHKNILYFAGGANGDTVNSWDGAGNITQVVFNNSSGTAIDAKYIFQKWNFGFLSGMNGTTADDNAMVVRHSEISDMTSWPAGNTIGANPGGGVGGMDAYGNNYTTGFASYTGNDGDWLLILTRRAIYSCVLTGGSVSPFYIDSAIANGCVAQDAYVSLGVDSGDGVYLSENGIHSLRQSQLHGGRQEKFLSWKIRPLMNTLNRTRLKYAKAVYWPEHSVVLFAVPTGANLYNDTILCLDLKGVGRDSQGRLESLTAENAMWSIWRLGGSSAQSVNVFAPAQDTSRDPYIYFGNRNGQVGRFTLATYQDIGASGYATDFISKHRDYGAPHVEKTLGDVMFSLQPGGSWRPNYQPIFDFGRFGEVNPLDMPGASVNWDEFNWDQANWSAEDLTRFEKVYGSGRGQTIAHRIYHAGTNQPWRIGDLQVEIGGLSPAVGHTTEQED